MILSKNYTKDVKKIKIRRLKTTMITSKIWKKVFWNLTLNNKIWKTIL